MSLFSRKNNVREEATDYWMSYSDLLAGLLLIIILFLFVAIMNFNDNKDILIEQTKVVEVQEERLLEQQKLLSKQEELIEELVGVKKAIIIELIHTMQENNIEVNIDQETGDIILGSNVFFDHDSYKLKETGEVFLEKFIPAYLGVLTSEKNKIHISEIIIEGHTDNDGDYLYNLELSQKRALEVTKFIDELVEINIGLEEQTLLRQLITSNGKSFSKLIIVDGKVNKSASRRVEFKFGLKDTEALQEIDKIIGGE